jgi:hypothetical protein
LEAWLLRDSLRFEEGDKLVLFGGAPPSWFGHPAGMTLETMPTGFGPCTLADPPAEGGATLGLNAAAPGGCVLQLPGPPNAVVLAKGQPVTPQPNGDFALPRGVRDLSLMLPSTQVR